MTEHDELITALPQPVQPPDDPDPTIEGLYFVRSRWGSGVERIARWTHDPTPHWRSVSTGPLEDDNRMPEGRISYWRGPLMLGVPELEEHVRVMRERIDQLEVERNQLLLEKEANSRAKKVTKKTKPRAD